MCSLNSSCVLTSVFFYFSSWMSRLKTWFSLRRACFLLLQQLFFYAYSPLTAPPPFQFNSTHAHQPPNLDVESCRNAFLKMTDNLHSVDAPLDPAPIPKFLSKKCKKKKNNVNDNKKESAVTLQQKTLEFLFRKGLDSQLTNAIYCAPKSRPMFST